MAHEPNEKDLEISTIVLICLFVIVLVAILTIIVRNISQKRKQRSGYLIDNSPEAALIALDVATDVASVDGACEDCYFGGSDDTVECCL
ncbi:uncharacterized protein LOC135431903 isoform X11 [Drosophila montana]|uniref:uncharacterized protein LOC135431903 isoform X11 n=1 Tax=Drosophila montana TaxID=40370 RepID=UPI00313B5F78